MALNAYLVFSGTLPSSSVETDCIVPTFAKFLFIIGKSFHT